MSLSLSDLLKRLMEMSGSDLHITTNSPPQIRVHGHLVPLDLPQMTPADTKQLAYSVMTDAQKHRFEESLELDFSFGLKGLARFRANVFNQRGATSRPSNRRCGSLKPVASLSARCTLTRRLPPSTESSTSSRHTSSRRFARNCHSCWKGLCAKAFCPNRTGKAGQCAWRSWFRMPPSAT